MIPIHGSYVLIATWTILNITQKPPIHSSEVLFTAVWTVLNLTQQLPISSQSLLTH
jgi:hypothetical protein